MHWVCDFIEEEGGGGRLRASVGYRVVEELVGCRGTGMVEIVLGETWMIGSGGVKILSGRSSRRPRVAWGNVVVG